MGVVRRSGGKGCMSGGKVGATRRERVVPGLSPRSLATCTLCPHGVRPREARGTPTAAGIR